MGRFETAAEFYRFREPYPPPLFTTVAGKLALAPQTRMLDVACGPGNLAIGFAPFVGSITAIDIEPEMLRLARQHASQIRFLQTPIEELDAEPSSFDFVTIGRALHWLPREATLAVFERILAPNGRIAICAAIAETSDWTEKFRELRRAWSNEHDETKYRPNLDDWFAPSRLRQLDQIFVQQTYRFTLDEIIGRALSFSITSPAVLGPRRTEFENALRTTLEPFLKDGLLEEEITGKAIIFG